jgi:serine/threonine protein kinase
VKNSVLLEELKIYDDLKGGEGIPQIHWDGEYKNYKIFIMDLLGPSLDKFFKIENKLSLETTIFFGEQMIRRLEYLHSKNYIHRDIKPNNFLLGSYNRKFNDNKVYIIDFGLSKEYIDKKTKKHYEYNESSKFVGTPRYASVNTHMGIRQSRRDDLESVAYILIYFLNGELPWQGIKAKTKSEKKEKIKISKKNFDIINQCEHYKNIPGELIEFLEYTKNLKFFEKPNYDYIVMLINNIRKNYFPINPVYNENYLMFEWNEKFLNMKKSMNKSKNSSIDRSEINDENINNFNKSDNDYIHMEKLFLKLYEGYPIQDFNEFLVCVENIENDNNNFYNKLNIGKKIFHEQMNFLENKRIEENKNNCRTNKEEEMEEIIDNPIYHQNFYMNKEERNNSDIILSRELQLSNQKSIVHNSDINSSDKKNYGAKGINLTSNLNRVKDFNNMNNKNNN